MSSTTVILIPTPTSPFPTSTGSPTSQESSFVGNAPATVLFFLALGVGIFIGSLFLFFTLRYFVRARYGLNVYSLSRRNIILSSLDSLQNIDQQWEFIRLHHDYLLSRLRDRTLTNTGNMITLNRRSRRNRRRNNRFSKMKKLTIEEVEELFPKTTYKKWLHLGKKDYTNILQEEEIEMEQIQPTIVNQSLRNSIELTAMTPDNTNFINSSNPLSNTSLTNLDSFRTLSNIQKNQPKSVDEINSENDNQSYDLSNPHYTSGSCAICLEIIEEEDEVRGLMCGHVFHSDCLDPWLTKRRACCPMCKRDYYKNDNNQGQSSNSNDRVNSTNNDVNQANSNESNNITSSTESATNNNYNNNNDTVNTNNDTPNSDTNTGNNDNTNFGNNNNNDNNDDDDSNNNNNNINNNNGNNNSNSNNNNNNNNESNTQNNNSDDEESFTFETFRSDPVIRAMLQELIPPAERIRLILSDDSITSLNLDQQANEMADKKFNNIFKRIWWRVMGITRENIYHWAVLKLYNDHRLERARHQNATTENQESSESQPPDNTSTSNPGDDNNETTNDRNSEIEQTSEIVASEGIHSRSNPTTINTQSAAHLPYIPAIPNSNTDYINRQV